MAGFSFSFFPPIFLSWDIGLHLPLDLDLSHQHSWFSDLQTQTGIYTFSFPGNPFDRQQIVEILSLHNCVPHFLI
jgi:hypothetical protein